MGPDYAAPETTVPDAWHEGIRRDLAERDSRTETWWEGFGERTLAKLIDEAREKSRTLVVAASRVREALLTPVVAPVLYAIVFKVKSPGNAGA